jgi:hypothetical protein
MAMLRDAQNRQATYMNVMHTTEDRMMPVMTAFGDQVLFLKHNLNARHWLAQGHCQHQYRRHGTDPNHRQLDAGGAQAHLITR